MVILRRGSSQHAVSVCLDKAGPSVTLQDLVVLLVAPACRNPLCHICQKQGHRSIGQAVQAPRTDCMCAAMVLGRHQVSIDSPKAGFEQGVDVRVEAWLAASALLAVSAAAGCEKPCVNLLAPIWHHQLVGRHHSSVPYS